MASQPSFEQSTPSGMPVEVAAQTETKVQGPPQDLLSEDQLRIAQLAAEGKTYVEIAAEVGDSCTISKVRTKLHDVYSIFGVPDKAHMAAMLITDDDRLNNLAVDQLARRQRELFSYVGSGLSYQEAAQRMNVSGSTVRTHSKTVRTALGLAGIVDLTIVAQAYTRTNEAAAQELQPQVLNVLRQIHQAHRRKELNADRRMIHTVGNPETLETLAEYGYISELLKKAGGVGLPGLVAAILISPKREASRNIILEGATKGTAYEIITRESAYAKLSMR